MVASELTPEMIELENASGFAIGVLTYGASWVSCRVPMADGSRREVLLGCSDDDFRRQDAYLGACIGRFAGRLRDARINIDGRAYTLDGNNGAHCLHGGRRGFGRREWTLEELAADRARLAIVSPDGEDGFPGLLTAETRYSLDAQGSALTIEFLAAVDRPCPVSLTNHAYFNLDGARADGDCRGHRLRVDARRFLTIDADGVPDGSLREVGGTPFDFREGRALAAALSDSASDRQLQLNRGYNHAYLVDPACRPMARPAAELTSGDGALAMRLYTTLPALQVYTGNYLAGTAARDGGVYADYAGIALEAEYPPDAPNHPQWPTPSCILRPGSVYRHAIRFVFSSAA